MLRKTLFALLGLVMLLNVRASACSVPSPMFVNNYITAVNSYAHTTDGGASYVNGGNVSLPITLFMQVTKVHNHNNVVPIAITHLKLQYKVKPLDGDWGTTWTDCKSIDNPDWSVNFEDGPVPLFGKNVLDIPDLPTGSEILIRVWLSTDLYQNANPDDDTDDTGVPGAWGQGYVVRVVFDGNRKIIK